MFPIGSVMMFLCRLLLTLTFIQSYPTSAAEALSPSFESALAEGPLRHTSWLCLLVFIAGSIMSFAAPHLNILNFQAFPGLQYLVGFLYSVCINDFLLTEYRAQRSVQYEQSGLKWVKQDSQTNL